MRSNPTLSTGAIWAQILLAGVTIAAIAVVPPARGRMLVVPLGTAGEGDAIRIALDNGARLLDRGPLPRSIVVDGDRARLSRPMLVAGMALTTIATGGCYGTEARA